LSKYVKEENILSQFYVRQKVFFFRFDEHILNKIRF